MVPLVTLLLSVKLIIRACAVSLANCIVHWY